MSATLIWFLNSLVELDSEYVISIGIIRIYSIVVNCRDLQVFMCRNVLVSH